MDKPKHNVGDTVIFNQKILLRMTSEEKEILSKPCHIEEIKFDNHNKLYFYKLTEFQYMRNIWYAEHCFLNTNEPNNLLNWLPERSKNDL